MAQLEVLGAELGDLKRFIATWTARDRYDRFGTTSESAAHWLMDERADPAHRGLVAYADGELVALLDFVRAGSIVECGVFVKDDQRRSGIGRALLRHLLSELRTGDILVAYCQFQNRPAIAFLSACDFSLEDARTGECRWRRRVTPGYGIGTEWPA